MKLQNKWTDYNKGVKMAYAYVVRYSGHDITQGIKCICSSLAVAEKHKKQIEDLGANRDPIIEKWEIWKR